mgnify:CR=1 FL=1
MDTAQAKIDTLNEIKAKIEEGLAKATQSVSEYKELGEAVNALLYYSQGEEEAYRQILQLLNVKIQCEQELQMFN